MSKIKELKQDRLFKAMFAALIGIGSVGLVGSGALAQESDEDEEDMNTVVIEQVEEDEDGPQDRIVVTGSRVSRDEYTSISPVQVVDSEVARDLGLVDAADLLRQTTVIQGQQITTGVSTSAGLQTGSGPGSASASLRGLDPGRTLVLINGKRLAPAGVRGVPENPDLNLIPGTLIERTDILLDGASSIYGSDAVAGVINFILKTDFDGLELDAFYTDPEMSGDGGKQQVYTATWGVNNDKGFIGFSAEHSKTDGFNERDFGSFYSPYAGDCRSRITQGASGTLYESCTGSFGAGAASTSAFGFLGFEPGRSVPGLPNGFFPIPVTADLLTPGSENGAALLLFPEELNATFLPDFDRTTIYSIGEYAPGFYGDMTAYFEASWSSRDTNNSTSGQGAIDIPGDYAVDNFGGLPGTVFFNSNLVNKTEVSQTRIIGGLKGDLPFMDVGTLDNWYYDAYASYSRSSGTDVLSGLPFFPRLEQTLANTRFDEATGEFVCDPRTIPNVGQTVNCRPLDFFDPTFIFSGRFPDEADNEFLFPNRIVQTTVVQRIASGFISGELFELPTGGPVSLVLGGEYREDSIGTDTDAGASAGDFQGFSADPGSNGERWLQEGFIELDVPLLLDKPFVHELTFNFAGRLTEEQNFGTEPTFRIQGQYAPTDWVRARATFGTSFRAPNLGEQFGGRTTGFVGAGFGDPCRVPGVAVPFVDDDGDPDTPEVRLYNPDLDPRDAAVIQNCEQGGGPFNLEPTDPTELGVEGLGTQNPVFFGAPTQVASGSNPNLDAETSDALSAGLVFEQPWFDGFDLRVSGTYFKIEVDDEVDQLSANVIVNRCYNSPGLTDPTCEFITRDPRVPGDDTSGEISFVEALNQNLGTQEVEGIDWNGEFRTDFALGGLEQRIDYNASLRVTQMLTQTEEEIRVDDVFIDDDLEEFGNPEWRLNLTNIVGYGDWRFLWQTRYISAMIEDNDPEERQEEQTSFFNPCVQAEDGPCLQFDGLDDYWVHDSSLSWRGETTVVRFGVSNVFDNAPPLTDNNSLAAIGGIGYDLGGRTYFVNLTWSL